MKALLALRSVGFCVRQSQMCLNVRWNFFFVLMQQKFLCHSVVGFCLFTMNGNCSITMIVFALLILLGESKRIKMNLDKFSWTLIILGAVVIFGTFIKDYTEIVIEQGFYKAFAHILQNPAFIEITKTYIPETFAWGWFLLGELLILAGIGKSLIHRK